MKLTIEEALEALKKAEHLIRATRRIVTTIELCRDGLWEDHQPALDSILRDFRDAGFELAPSTLADITEEL